MTQSNHLKKTTRDIIKASFISMYKSTPLNQISVSNLSAASNISRGTFYLHFKDVYALYKECEQDLINQMEKDVPGVILCTVASDYEKYVEAFTEVLKVIIQYIDDFKFFLCGSEESSFRKAWFESIRRNYEQTVLFSRNVSTAQRDNLTRFFAGGTLSILSNWALTGCKESAEDIASISAQILFQGAFLAKHITSGN